VGSRPTAPTPNLGDQDFLSGLSPLAFVVPTPLFQGNRICNPRQGPFQGAISRSQTKPGLLLLLLLSGLFHDAVSISDYVMSNGRMMVNNELERIWKEAAWVLSWYNPAICLLGLRKTTKISVRVADIRTEYSNREHSKYKSISSPLHWLRRCY
jgi:hypothetical protein